MTIRAQESVCFQWCWNTGRGLHSPPESPGLAGLFPARYTHRSGTPIWRYTLAILALLFLPACTHTPDRAMVLLGSHHVAAKPLNDGSSFREVNPGLFLEWDAEPLTVSTGAFMNSYGKPSVAGFVGLPVLEARELDISLIGGLAYYPIDGRTFNVSFGDIVPLGGVQIKFGQAVVQVFPSDCTFTCAIVSSGVAFDF